MTLGEWFDGEAAEIYAMQNPDKNVWPSRYESGIDYTRMPSLAGSGLEKFFQGYRDPTPLPYVDRKTSEPKDFIEMVVALLWAPLLLLYPLFYLRGEALLERALERDAYRNPEITWESMTTLLRNSNWGHP